VKEAVQIPPQMTADDDDAAPMMERQIHGNSEMEK